MSDGATTTTTTAAALGAALAACRAAASESSPRRILASACGALAGALGGSAAARGDSGARARAGPDAGGLEEWLDRAAEAGAGVVVSGDADGGWRAAACAWAGGAVAAAGPAAAVGDGAWLAGVAGDLESAAARGAVLARAREERDRLRWTVDGARLGSWEWNVRTGTVAINETWAELVGRTRAELSPTTFETWESLVHPDDVEAANAALAACIDGSRPAYRAEFRMRHRDGRWVWIQDRGAVMRRDGEGRPLLMHGTHQDITARRAAEEALRAREEQQRAIIESSPAAIFTLDAEGVVLTWNGAAERIFGWREEEAVGRLLPIVPEGSEEEFAENRRRVLAGEVLRQVELVRCCKDGMEVVASLSTAAIHDREGRPAAILAVVEDITERRRVVEELESSRRFLEDLIEHNEALFFAKDLEGRYRLANRKWEAVTGMSRDEVLGRTDPELFPASTAEDFSANDRRVIESGGSVEAEEELLSGEGGKRVFNTIKFPWRDSAGAVRGVLGFATETTERRRAEEAVRESEERFSIAFRHSPAPLVLSEVDTGVFIDVNDRWVELLEFGRDEQVGRPSKEVGIWADPADRDRMRAKLRREGRLRDEPIEFRSKSGRAIPALWSAEVVQIRGREAMLSMITDLTRIRNSEEEKAQLSEQLHHAQKLESVGRLAGGVAHDFNNMLNVILGNADLLLEDAPREGEGRERLEDLRAAAKRSADLTRQLLAFARKQVAAPRVLDLNATVESMLRMIERLLGERIRLDWRPAADLRTVRIDPAQVDQILVNLCINARDAIGERHGRIAIRTAGARLDAVAAASAGDCDPGDYAVLCVADDGCGMDEDVKSKLFEPFFTTKGLGEGTGLGLPTVYGIVRQNRGFIEVESAPGRGAEFRVHLPVHSSRGTPSPADTGHGATRRGGRGTVLVVEDEPSILKLASLMLGRLGYQAICAPTPGEAIRIARSHTGAIDLLLTDVVMPEMNGRDLAKALLPLHPGLKRLFMSGYTAEVIAHEGMLDEGVRFLEKPFSMRSLGEKVREALDA